MAPLFACRVMGIAALNRILRAVCLHTERTINNKFVLYSGAFPMTCRMRVYRLFRDKDFKEKVR
jgi:hypothetical protein